MLAGASSDIIYLVSTACPTTPCSVQLLKQVLPALPHLVDSLSQNQHVPKVTVTSTTLGKQPQLGPVSLQSNSCPGENGAALPNSTPTVGRPLSQQFQGLALPTSTPEATTARPLSQPCWAYCQPYSLLYLQ